MNKSTISIALKGIAVAMGVAMIVINILDALTANAAFLAWHRDGCIGHRCSAEVTMNPQS